MALTTTGTFLLALPLIAAFTRHPNYIAHPQQVRRILNEEVTLNAKKKKKRSSGGGGSAAGVGIKGFGSSPSSSKKHDAAAVFTMDRSKDTLEFYDSMEKNYGAGDNLKRVALAYFPLRLPQQQLPNDDNDKNAQQQQQLRGVVALRDIKKGDTIIRIPYEMAINLGREGEDPTIPGLALLKDYCQTLALASDDEESTATTTTDHLVDRIAYYRLLPPFLGDDCLGSTDFFTDDALEALQAPLIIRETLDRRERTHKRFVQHADDDDDMPLWIDGTTVTEEHLRWAVWLVTSRVLTVQGDADEGQSYRLLIPFLDMCNHDRSSPHVLTGRAVPGGELKVVAGQNVQAGEQINICYGGGVAGNDRFLQDYGFLDSEVADDLVAQQLLGKRRIVEGAGAGRNIAVPDMEKTLDALRSTTIEQDEALLEEETNSSVRSAIEYRLGLKRALAKYMVMS